MGLDGRADPGRGRGDADLRYTGVRHLGAEPVRRVEHVDASNKKSWRGARQRRTFGPRDGAKPLAGDDAAKFGGREVGAASATTGSFSIHPSWARARGRVWAARGTLPGSLPIVATCSMRQPFLFLTVYAVRMSSPRARRLLDEASPSCPASSRWRPCRARAGQWRLLPTAIFAAWSIPAKGRAMDDRCT